MELMVAILLVSLVILLSWTGMVSALNTNQVAQIKTARQVELARALDAMTAEIRQAQAVNRSGSVVANGSTVTLTDVVTHGGVDLNDLGNYGEIALYLEIPTDTSVSACPSAGGSIPAAALDRVVYDVRTSPVGWLSPRAIARYGRIPDGAGRINPCSAPVANDIMADAIAQTSDSPTCSGVLSGSGGFHTCVEGDEVGLIFKSAISDVDVLPLSSTVTPRTVDFTPTATQDLNLSLTRSGGHHVLVTWSWNTSLSSPHSSGYELVIEGPNKVEVKTIGADKVEFKYDLNKVSSQDTDQICFELETTNASNESVNSNRICTYKVVTDVNQPYWEETGQNQTGQNP
ncbi:hypothetical protein QQ91_0014095 [Lyngbya confervoides BDU141951]|uniref:Uncharacterized protein n=2 Tax=Lyngbya TaxID=28073 RepID=A0ABD4T6S8_9CYAN|nr:hypothetical protein [Lyngbya confervoides]MCM1983950.1 hypothetical protein [Lyngbya confervoides BDU141951]